MPQRNTGLSMRLAAAPLAVVLQLSAGLAQDKAQAPKNPMAGFPDLIAGLKATPGCLGVETARTSSGKQVIFAWFENKKAVLRWYSSETHLKAMKMAFPDHTPGEPMKGVTDNDSPIMAVASLTLGDKPQVEGSSFPIKQISIELYQPLTGGIFSGGRFAPDTL